MTDSLSVRYVEPTLLTCPSCKGTYFIPVQQVPLGWAPYFGELRQLYFCIFCQSTVEILPEAPPRIFSTPHRHSS